MESLGRSKSRNLRATGPKGPKVFGRGAYQGTPFTMIAQRLFHIMSFFWHHKQEFVIFSVYGAPREYHGQYLKREGIKIYIVKYNILIRDVERM